VFTYYVGVAVFVYCLGPMVVMKYIPFISVFFVSIPKNLTQIDEKIWIWHVLLCIFHRNFHLTPIFVTF